MIKISKIAVPTDFSETAVRAVNHGALLAKIFGASLHLVNVIEKTDYMKDIISDMPGEIPEELVDAQQSIYQFMEEYADKKLEETSKGDYACSAPSCHTVFLKDYPPSAAIAKYAKKNEIDLVVMGTHGRTGISEWFFGSTTERLVRISPCPVLAVGPQSEQHPKDEVFDNILFPFDLSEASRHALPYACAMAEKFNAKLNMLHVVEYRNLPESYTVQGSEIFKEVTDLEQKILAEMEKQLNDLYKGSHSLNAEMTVEEGKPFEKIIDFAEEKGANLIVIGNTGANETHGHKLGSTAENIMPRAACPVLVINSKTHEFVK